MPATWTDSHGATSAWTPDDERVIDGRRHLTYILTGTAVGASDEVALSVPKWATLVELAADATVHPTATKVTPVAGTHAAFTAGGRYDVTPTGITGALHVRTVAPSPFYGGTLVVRPVPDGGSDSTVVLQVTVVEGHGAVA